MKKDKTDDLPKLPPFTTPRASDVVKFFNDWNGCVPKPNYDLNNVLYFHIYIYLYMHVALEAKPPTDTPPAKKRLVEPNGTPCANSGSSQSLAATEAVCFVHVHFHAYVCIFPPHVEVASEPSRVGWPDMLPSSCEFEPDLNLDKLWT